MFECSFFSEVQEGKPVEVLRTGTFEDKRGKTVKVTLEDLETFVANFKAGAAGQEVPIDVDHERAGAAGWVADLWRAGDKLMGSVDWNDRGRELVGGRVYRYLSATIDLARKVIKTISLVNFPAVKGLAALELSEDEAGKTERPFDKMLQDWGDGGGSILDYVQGLRENPVLMRSLAARYGVSDAELEGLLELDVMTDRLLEEWRKPGPSVGDADRAVEQALETGISPEMDRALEEWVRRGWKLSYLQELSSAELAESGVFPGPLPAKEQLIEWLALRDWARSGGTEEEFRGLSEEERAGLLTGYEREVEL